MRVPYQVAFLTGQSHPPAAALHPSQAAFLASLPLPMAARVSLNFPYPFETPARPFVPTSLLAASVRNTWQHFASRRPAFAAYHRPAVVALLARAERTLFLAGSCGLELFNNLELPASLLRKITLFAFGPVARRRPACDCLLVQGRRDWISRSHFRTVDASVGGGHMDYLTDPAVLALATRAVRRLAARSGTALTTR